MPKIHTHYDTLSVVRNAPPEVIRAAYKILSQKHHPDRNSDNPNVTAIMAKINDAYAVLSDPEKRKKYDKWLAEQEVSATQQDKSAQKPEPEKKTYQTKSPDTSPLNVKTSSLGKGILLPVICMIVIAVAASAYDEFRRKQQHEQFEETIKKLVTFEKEKALGEFEIEGMTVNGRFISYGEYVAPIIHHSGTNLLDGSGYTYDYNPKHYSDSWPYDDSIYGHRPTGRVTVSENEMIVHIDWNRDSYLDENEKKIFKINSISKSTNPDEYKNGIIGTDIDERVSFIMENAGKYSLLYRDGNDQYKLWLK